MKPEPLAGYARLVYVADVEAEAKDPAMSTGMPSQSAIDKSNEKALAISTSSNADMLPSLIETYIKIEKPSQIVLAASGRCRREGALPARQRKRFGLAHLRAHRDPENVMIKRLALCIAAVAALAGCQAAAPSHALCRVRRILVDKDLAMVPGWNTRILNRREAQEGSSIALDDKTGVISLDPGVYHVIARLDRYLPRSEARCGGDREA